MKQEVAMLSSTEVARRLGVSRRTVRRWVAAGLLPAYRMGGILRIHPEDLEGFLARSRTGVGSAGEREVGDERGVAAAGAGADWGCAG